MAVEWSNHSQNVSNRFGNPYQQRIQKEMVAVAGIEPASESISIQATTCLAQVLLDSQCLLGVTSLSLGGWKFK